MFTFVNTIFARSEFDKVKYLTDLNCMPKFQLSYQRTIGLIEEADNMFYLNKNE